jgi:hypothetical protein
MRRTQNKRNLAIPLALAIAVLLAAMFFVSPRARLVTANVYYRAQIRWLDSAFARYFQSVWSIVSYRKAAYESLAKNGAVSVVHHDFGIRLSPHD